jgi:fatty acid desaturase
MIAAVQVRARPIFRASRWDALLLGAAIAQGALIVAAAAQVAPGPGALAWAFVIAAGVWWNSNTVAHNHLHNPLFAARAGNRAFALYLSVLTSVPQSVWRARHLRHHAGPHARAPRGLPAGARLELALIAASWALLLALAPAFFLAAWLPGFAIGMLLCRAHGHFEHAGAGADGISHYGAIYNLLWLNDGYHREHHLHPGEHWTRLPARRARIAGPESVLPPVARLLQPLHCWALGWLERAALAWRPLQRFMLATHERAFRALLPSLAERDLSRICVVGGGLFPRTALVLRRLLPRSRIVILDASADSLARARSWLAAHGHPPDAFELVHARFDAADDCGCDLVVVPLAFAGDRAAVYRRPGTIVHDWIWRRRGRAGVRVSWLLLKRLNVSR